FPGVFVDAWHRVTGASRRQPKYDLPVLDHVSGALEPGTMTLLLAPPGHGKSALLKALSQRMSGALAKHTSGSITYNGRTAAELQAEGARVTKLVSYVESRDNHYAQLTVKETLEFAARTMRAVCVERGATCTSIPRFRCSWMQRLTRPATSCLRTICSQ
ncbi:ATP-binding cassette domain-containing protein, partial [archaeon]